jgi:hypothetical protein
MVGDVYVPGGCRLSDVLNAPEHEFVVLTHVTIERGYAATPGFCSTLFVNRRNIRFVGPQTVNENEVEQSDQSPPVQLAQRDDSSDKHDDPIQFRRAS